MRVLLQNDLVVQKTAANTSEDVMVAEGAEDSVVHKQARHGPDARPVFRSESGGGRNQVLLRNIGAGGR